MSPQTVITILRDALLNAFWLSLPLLLVGFIAGIIVSLIQIVTSIQDSAFNTIPRLLAFLVALFLFLPWMTARMVNYTTQLFSDFSRYAN